MKDETPLQNNKVTNVQNFQFFRENQIVGIILYDNRSTLWVCAHWLKKTTMANENEEKWHVLNWQIT